MDDSQMLLLLAPVAVIELVMKVVALVHLSRHETRGPKWAWVLIILFVSMFGWLAYFIAGRRET